MIAGRTSLSGALSLATVLASLPARGEGDSVRVSYVADPAAPGCPAQPEFVDAVRARLRKAALAQGDLAAREYRVSVRAAGARFVALVEFEDAAGTVRSREVGAETCPDVAGAIALVTALAIDAGGMDAAGIGEGELTPSEALGVVPQQDTLQPSAASAPPAPPPSVPPPAPRPRETARPSAAPVPPDVELGVRATLTSPKAPSVLPGVEVFASVASPRRAWRLELGLAGERGFRSEGDAGSALFSFIGGRLRACAFSLELGRAVELWPCVSLEGGALIARGYIDNPSTKVDAWVAAGAALRLGYRFASGGVHLEAGPSFPIARNTYVFGPAADPTETAHEVPTVGVQAAFGATLQIF